MRIFDLQRQAKLKVYQARYQAYIDGLGKGDNLKKTALKLGIHWQTLRDSINVVLNNETPAKKD
jgi:hypothetical protein